MKRTISTLIILLLSLGLLAKNKPRSQTPPAAPEAPQVAKADNQRQWTGTLGQKLLGLMTIWAEAKFNFPYFDRIPDVDWDHKVQEYIPRVLGAESLTGYYELLMEFAALLKDGHTWVVPPWMFVRPGYDHPPLELQVAENRFLVARAGETDELKKQNVYPGLEILEVGDQIPVRAYLQENVLRFRSCGTPQADEAIGLCGIFNGPRNRFRASEGH